jgi:hypothetical protein
VICSGRVERDQENRIPARIHVDGAAIDDGGRITL